MKKIVSILLVCLILTSMSAFASSGEVIIDGNTVEIAEGLGSVTEVEGVVFIPVRFILEHFGYQVEWADKEQLVMAADSLGAMAVLQVDNSLLFFTGADGEGKISMEKAMFLNNEQGRNYIPASAVAQLFGYKLSLDEETDTIMFTK